MCVCVCVGRKKYIQESIKQESYPNSSGKTMWYLEPIGIGASNAENTTELPSFVLNAVKVNLLQKVYSFFSLYKFLYKIKKRIKNFFISLYFLYTNAIYIHLFTKYLQNI